MFCCKLLVKVYVLTILLGNLKASEHGFHRQKRIVGGSPANISDFPFQLSLQLDGVHKCGAALISDTWAITTGYCVRHTATERISLRAGTAVREEGGVVSAAKNIVLHALYDEVHTDYDIAAVQVETAFLLGENIQPVSLPTQDEDVVPGMIGVVAGWGTTQFGIPGYTKNLLKVEVPIISNDDCNSRYQFFGRVNSRMICAAYEEDGKDSCQGDNGGPLMVQGKVQGLVSWAIGCGRADYPHVYTRVAFFRDWIRNATGV
ncbi:trypsin-1 [Anabrus simplex]|uniref:trypsin-1 n=1 Tax=Anabrus simplex TaxID=316456 RepID=UPI0035A3B23D